METRQRGRDDLRYLFGDVALIVGPPGELRALRRRQVALRGRSGVPTQWRQIGHVIRNPEGVANRGKDVVGSGDQRLVGDQRIQPRRRVRNDIQVNGDVASDVDRTVTGKSVSRDQDVSPVPENQYILAERERIVQNISIPFIGKTKRFGRVVEIALANQIFPDNPVRNAADFLTPARLLARKRRDQGGVHGLHGDRRIPWPSRRFFIDGRVQELAAALAGKYGSRGFVARLNETARRQYVLQQRRAGTADAVDVDGSGYICVIGHRIRLPA